jgi:hypothetical protein
MQGNNRYRSWPAKPFLPIVSANSTSKWNIS